MPAVSEKQRRLMAAALHGAKFAKAKAIRQSMSPEQMREFTRTKRAIRNTTDMHTPTSRRHKG